ncbi:hypothetical protein [Micromonospora sp. ATCC 39149]|uniref:hypothetical protein n=1 Tax=Micromonospora sp. (strain ATCC 39149 / NRRL 15099 / SCC 1413) TaxID=219305 RepID=UPI00350FD826
MDPPLHAAARVADLDAACRLLAGGAEVDGRERRQGRTALFTAVEQDAGMVPRLPAAGP